MHAEGLRLVPDARLLGAVGTSPEKSAAFAAEFGLPRTYRDLEEMLADPAVAVVDVCTPPHTHVEIARRAAAAGKHVFIDKPIARNLAEADAIIAACDAAGVTLGGMFQMRFDAPAQAVKRAVGEGRLGDIVLADCYVKWWRDDAYYRNSKWRARRATEGGGALINQAIHSIDLLQWLAGPVLEVTGHVAAVAHDIETEDLGVALLRLAGGRGANARPAYGVLEGSTATYPGFAERIELHGTGGSVVLAGGHRVEWRLRGEEPRTEEFGRQLENVADPASFDPHGHAAALADFVAAVRAGRAPSVDGREARKALEVVEAVYRSSAAGGTPLRLPLAGA